MKFKQILFTVLLSAATTIAVIWGYGKWNSEKQGYGTSYDANVPTNYKLAGYGESGNLPPGGAIDFTQPSAAAIPTVVHIKTKTNQKQVSNNLPRRQNPFGDLFGDDLFNQFFGGPTIIPEQRASGSGVIISSDGYIVTNNHVIQDADEITVTLSDKHTYKAKVIGSDPSYDLAVIKINDTNLPFLLYGNSDDVKIGQWVLAIGYPMDLETTVTAGIVSAKERSLGLNKDRSGNYAGGVESFIQTDAAVNPGNSGGALINTDGKLIGINSAIASRTGYYAGYSYAIPVNIVKKVVDDIIKYGSVQRGYIGIAFTNASDMTDDAKIQYKIPADAFDGIYVTDVPKDGSAYQAGIKVGDRIDKINNTAIGNGSELQEQVSRYKPGDKVSVTFTRGGRQQTVVVTLKNKAGTYDIVKNDVVSDVLGADLVTLDAQKAKDLGVSGGVYVKKIKKGAIYDQTRMKDGFIILKIDDQSVKSVDDLRKAIGQKRSINISGFYPGYDAIYEYPITLSE